MPFALAPPRGTPVTAMFKLTGDLVEVSMGASS